MAQSRESKMPRARMWSSPAPFKVSDVPSPLTHSLTALALLAFAAPASAHIELLEPTPRYAVQGTETGIKSCPCGSGGSNRTCNVTVDGSDPDRSDQVSRFEAGSTITLRFEEFVDHVGSFRVAFDPDGADFMDFNGNILVPLVADPAAANGTIWEIDVPLPNMICSNCTLQLIQAMNGDMVNPVVDPANVSSYYACVDLELVAPGTLGEGGAPGTPVTSRAMTAWAMAETARTRAGVAWAREVLPRQ